MSWKPTEEQFTAAIAVANRFDNGFPDRAPHRLYLDMKLEKIAVMSVQCEAIKERLEDQSIRYLTVV